MASLQLGLSRSKEAKDKMSDHLKVGRSAVCFSDPDAFASEMIKMINDKDYSDVKFSIGQEKQIVYAHRCILAARCEVFHAMLSVAASEEDTESPLILSEIRPQIFLAVLEFIYTNCCSLSTNMVIEVMAAGIEYGLDELVKLCVHFMRDSIEVSTVCEFLQAALTYQQMSLQEECLFYVETNTEEVFKSSGFNEMSEDSLAFILKSDKLRLDEMDILSKVKEWASVNAVVSGASIAEVASSVIEHVRFPLLDTDQLNTVEKENTKNYLVPVHLIAASWKFHALQRPDPSDPQTRPRVGTLPRPSLRAVGRGPEQL